MEFRNGISAALEDGDKEIPTPPPADPPAPAESPEKGPIRQPVMELFDLDIDKASDESIQDVVRRQVEFELDKSKLTDRYRILLLHDEGPIGSTDSSRIYSALGATDRTSPILLILSSPGGDIPTAYFIGKLCREHTSSTFEVVVPRQAKSAATLICCAADRIHMGSLSELGPIDPQFGNVPALALKHSVEHIAQLVTEYPGSAEMFSKYLSRALKIESLGYYERVAASAMQYATRLLGSRRKPESTVGANEQIARRLVYDYKDHGFVIDSREAADIFGDDVVVTNTEEYRVANALSVSLSFASWVCGFRLNRRLTYVGGTTGCWVFPKRQ